MIPSPNPVLARRVIPWSIRGSNALTTTMSRSQAAASTTKWTYAAWVKINDPTKTNTTFLMNANIGLDTDDYSGVWITTDDKIVVGTVITNVAYTFTTTAVYYDPSGWFHLVAIWDTENASASERARIYINGVRALGVFSPASIPQNTASYIGNTGFTLNFGRSSFVANSFNGNLADVHFLDGQALDFNSFVAIDPDNGTVVPKLYSGTINSLNDSIYLFDNTTNTTTLGYDSSGLGNNLTLSGYVRIEGDADDCIVLDSPDNTYCVFSGKEGSYRIDNGGLYTNIGGTSVGWHGTLAMKTGKWCWETTIETVGNAGGVGISRMNDPSDSTPGTGNLYEELYTGNKSDGTNGTGVAYASAWAIGVTLTVYFDADAGKIWVAQNGVIPSSGDPVAGTNPMYSGIAMDTWWPWTAGRSAIRRYNFGQLPIKYPLTGYNTLKASNFSNPAFHVKRRFRAFTYTGTGSENYVDFGMYSGLVILKSLTLSKYATSVDRTLSPSHYKWYSSGTHNWTVPNYVTTGVMKLKGCGGGAGSTSGIVNGVGGRDNEAGHGGGEAPLLTKTLSFTPSDSYIITLGSIGLGQTGLGNLGPGTAGGNATFSGPVGSFYSNGGYGGWSGGWGSPLATSGQGGLNSDGVQGMNQADGIGGGSVRNFNASANYGDGGSIAWGTPTGPGGNGGQSFCELDVSANYLPVAQMYGVAQTVLSNGIQWKDSGVLLGSNSTVNSVGDSLVGYALSSSLDCGMQTITYTGNGSSQVISHSLGVKPAFILIKRLDSTTNWIVYHYRTDATGADGYILALTNAQAASSSGYWSSITSASITLGSNSSVNANNGTYVMYVFAEVEGFSKFGYYIGNPTYGPVNYCGFQPAFVVIKVASGGNGNWRILDAARNPSNPITKRLWLNQNYTQDSSSEAAFRATGFRIMDGPTENETNLNGGRYVFAAFASLPLNLTRAL